ncbi:MAG: hypothetical protein Q8O01_07440, partial [Candidatus Omnitrophota bacterium]|nr:hypothetical protein [Candidatus Omnitrophota bacterium]
ELIDTNNNKSAIYLDGISAATETFYSVNLSKLTGTADLKKVSFIYIVLEGKNKTGTLEINKLKIANFVSPDATKSANDINIPTEGLYVPGISVVAPTGAKADINRTDRGLMLTYDTLNKGWAGAGFCYYNSNLGVLAKVSDFSSITNLIIGIKGSSPTAKFEIVDSSGGKASMYLKDIDYSVEKFFNIKLSDLAGSIDRTKIFAIYVIVEGNNKAGTLELNHARNSFFVNPDPTKTRADLNISMDSLIHPDIISTGGGVNVSVYRTSRGFRLDYDTLYGWAGAGLNWHDSSHFIDFAAFNDPFIFGVKGTDPTAKLQLEDGYGNKSSIFLKGISSTQEVFYSVSLGQLVGNANLHEITSAMFIVEGDKKSGTFEVEYFKRSIFISPDATKSADDINIPISDLALPSGVTVNPHNATAILTTTGRGISVVYDTSSGTNGGWAGAGFSYDTNPDTAALEYKDLSTLSSLVFGFKSTCSMANLELIDTNY